jgi:aryl-alcohol dehydrogenase
MIRIMRGRTVRGIIQGDSVPQQFIPRLVDLHMQGRLPFDRLITLYPLEDINQACADAAAGRVVKPVLQMGI